MFPWLLSMCRVAWKRPLPHMQTVQPPNQPNNQLSTRWKLHCSIFCTIGLHLLDIVALGQHSADALTNLSYIVRISFCLTSHIQLIAKLVFSRWGYEKVQAYFEPFLLHGIMAICKYDLLMNMYLPTKETQQCLFVNFHKKKHVSMFLFINM